MQFYQQLLDELQQRGVIRITQDGQVFIPRGRGDFDGRSSGGSRLVGTFLLVVFLFLNWLADLLQKKIAERQTPRPKI